MLMPPSSEPEDGSSMVLAPDVPGPAEVTVASWVRPEL